MANKTQLKYGYWTVLDAVPSRGYRKVFLCKCKCGTEREVLYQNLVYGKSRSCGCICKDLFGTGYAKISGSYWGRLQADAKRRNLKFEVSIEEAWQIFIEQNCKCALSGLDIQFAQTTKELYGGENTASLDRIDSSDGYNRDNVQWVHKDINKIKQDFPEDRFVFLCGRVAEVDISIRTEQLEQIKEIVGV